MSSNVALVSLSASTTVTATVSPERYATSLLRCSSADITAGVGDGTGVGVTVETAVGVATGVDDGVTVGVGVGTMGADSVVKLQE